MSLAQMDFDDQHGRNPPRRPTDMTLYERDRALRLLAASESVMTDSPERREVREFLDRVGAKA